MKVFRTIALGINTVGGGIAKAGVNATGTVVSRKFPETGKYMIELGDSVIHSSKAVIANTAHLADGTTTGIIGIVKKDEDQREEGWNDLKSAATNTATGVIGSVKYAGESIGLTVTGAVRQDRQQFVEGLKNVGKVATVVTLGVSVLDVAGAFDTTTVEAAELETRNMGLNGGTHSVTGIPFETNFVDHANGSYEGVFPVFDSAFDMVLPPETLEHSDTVHIGIANMELYEEIQSNPPLADDLGFSSQDIENLQSSVTPEGYDWHHHEEPGRMQLVNEQEHGMTGHTGGRNLWGGGTVAR